MPDRRPLFSAQPLPRAQVREAIPEESQHPGSFTARLRHWLLNDATPLFQAEQLQREHQHKVAEAEAAAEPAI